MTTPNPPIRAVPLPLFPTLNSLQEVLDYAESRMPVIHRNEMLSLLLTYHNTLLKLIEEDRTQLNKELPPCKLKFLKP